MGYRFTLAVAVVWGIVACSSTSTNDENGGGTGGAAGSGAGAGGTGGSNVTGGAAGTAGVAGALTGGGGGVDSSAGQGGTEAGLDSSADADAGPDAAVKCVGTTPCPADPGRCCFNVSTKQPVCQLEQAACASDTNTRIVCDGTEDCPSGEICCSTQNNIYYVDSGGPKPPTVGCKTECLGNTYTTAIQVCDPKQTSPTQCLKGSCKTVVHAGPAASHQVLELELPLGYGLCK